MTSYAPFLLIMISVIWIVHRAHISSERKSTAFDLIENTETGRASLEKVGMLTGIMTLTWWFIDLCASHTATWQDATAYGGMILVTKIAQTAISINKPNNG